MTNAPPLGAPAGRQQNASRPFIQPCSGSPLSAPAERSSPVGRGNNDQRAGHHRPIAPQPGDELREYLANQPRLVLIGVNGVARPCQFIDFRTFHGGSYAD